MAGKLTGAFCRGRSPRVPAEGQIDSTGLKTGLASETWTPGSLPPCATSVVRPALERRPLPAARWGQPSSTKDQHNGHFQQVTNILKRAGWRRAARTRADGRKKRLGRQGHRLQP